MAHAALQAETAAQLAVARVPVVQGTETVRDALQRLRGQRFDEIDTAFVVDADQRLVGAVPLAALLAAPDEAQVADWARPATFVRAGTDPDLRTPGARPGFRPRGDRSGA